MIFDYLYSIIESQIPFFIWLIAFFIVFGLLAQIMPCNKNQPLIREGMITDILYGIFIPIIAGYFMTIYLMGGFGIIFYGVPLKEIQGYINNGYGVLSTLPLWLQAAMVFILSDILLYFGHRWFHGKKMWKWHAIHHSPKTVDWLSTYRFHPVNTVVTFVAVNALMMYIGFSPESIAIMGTFNKLYSAMVHANLNWTFGKFKYMFASPVFHRWHHTTQQEGMNKNFAPTFPLLDVMFGTFYMPEGKLPEHYGVDGADIPEDFIGQIAWSFKQK